MSSRSEPDRGSGGRRMGVCVCWVGIAVLVLSGCQQIGCQSGGQADGREGPWPVQSGVVDHLSEEMSAVVFVRRAQALRRVEAFIGESVEGKAAIGGTRDAGEKEDAGRDESGSERKRAEPGTGVEALVAVAGQLLSEEAAGEIGLNLEAPAAVFRWEGRWVVGFERVGADQAASNAGAEPQVAGIDWVERSREGNGGSVGRISMGGNEAGGEGVVCGSAELLYVATKRGAMRSEQEVIEICDRLRTNGSGSEGEAPRGNRAWTDGWTRGGREASLMSSLVGGNEVVAGLVRPDRWLNQEMAMRNGQASRLVKRLAGQLGSLGWTGYHRPERGALSVTMRLQQSPGQPMAVADLGAGTGELPPMGGFVSEDVLGAVRFSSDPALTYQLVESLMPAERRREVTAYWDEIREKLTVRMPETLLDALAGHAVVVLFDVTERSRVVSGVDGETGTDGERGGGFWGHLLTGSATREAVLVPITNRAAVERVLDVATQLSEGKLSRDMANESVHYAWIGERGLSWAIVLTDDYLIFADNGAAFNRAVSYAREASSVSEVLTERGVDRLFDGSGRSGFYLRGRALSDRIRGAGWETGASMLAPAAWLLFTSETADGEGIGRLDIGYREQSDEREGADSGE